MKNKSILLSVCLLLPIMVQGQGTLYVSNLNQPSSGNIAVGSDSWLAGLFLTGSDPGGYTLNSVQLLMNNASGSPSGFSVSLYSFNSSSGFPESSLGILGGSPDPSAGGIFTYSSSGLMLSPSTDYLIVLTSATSVASGSYNWSIANTSNYNSSNGWFLGSGYFRSSDGLSWGFTRPLPFQFAIYATAVPEPATMALASLGMGALLLWRRDVR